MRQGKWVLLALTGAVFLCGGSVFAADSGAGKPQAMEQKAVRGGDMMTPEERAEHRKKMRSAKTAEEREKIRREEHEKMKQRAKEQGKSMPEQPPAQGQGMGSGGGMGPGGRR